METWKEQEEIGGQEPTTGEITEKEYPSFSHIYREETHLTLITHSVNILIYLHHWDPVQA